MSNNNPIKKCSDITEKLLKDDNNSKATTFKSGEDYLQRRVYFSCFINTLKIFLSKFKETCMILMEYPLKRG